MWHGVLEREPDLLMLQISLPISAMRRGEKNSKSFFAMATEESRRKGMMKGKGRKKHLSHCSLFHSFTLFTLFPLFSLSPFVCT
jgi:hypothetical protein